MNIEDRFIPKEELLIMLCVSSTTLDRLKKNPLFPKEVRYSKKLVRYSLQEVLGWMNDLIAQRDKMNCECESTSQ